MQLGLKLWSTNKQYIEPARELIQNDHFQYIELFSVIGTYNDTIEDWKTLNVPFIIHAPHSGGGINWASSSLREANKKHLEESYRFADQLKAPTIIIHPGIGDSFGEALSQLSALTDTRLCIENKPHDVQEEFNAIGSTPEEIATIIEATHFKFCLDIGHAICSANSHNADPLDYLKHFQVLNPAMYHLSDGDYKEINDSHLHLGEGSYPFSTILSLLNMSLPISLETSKNYKDRLDDAIPDALFIHKLLE